MKSLPDYRQPRGVIGGSGQRRGLFWLFRRYANGAQCSKQTIGLLGRRNVAIDSITYIGKESNRLEEVEERSLVAGTAVYTEYPDPRRDEWVTEILPKLKAMPLRELMERTGLPRSTLQAIRTGRRPHTRNAKVLVAIA